MTGLPRGAGTQRPTEAAWDTPQARLCPGQQCWLGTHLRPPQHGAQRDRHLGAKEARRTETRGAACAHGLRAGPETWHRQLRHLVPGEAARGDCRGARGDGQGAGRPGLTVIWAEGLAPRGGSEGFHRSSGKDSLRKVKLGHLPRPAGMKGAEDSPTLPEAPRRTPGH